MKLLVAELTFIGSRIAPSIAMTFSTPEPIPSSPDTSPAIHISTKPSGMRWAE